MIFKYLHQKIELSYYCSNLVLNGDNYELENAKDELADIVVYSMMLAEKLDLDLEEINKES